MNVPSFAAPFILACVALLAAPTVLAQTEVIKEGAVSEAALIDALAPEEPVRTRSIRVMRAGDSATPAKPAKTGPAKANLLITFETNSARLTDAARQTLDVVGAALASERLGQFRFGIEGYADPRGGAAENLRLSQARADSVRDYLVSKNHIERERLEPIGKGDRDPLNPANPTAPENRRVTIVNLSRQ